MTDSSDDTTAGFVEIAIDERGVICSWPPAAEDLFGYERQRALGSSLSELIVPPRLRARHEAGVRAVQDGGRGLLLGTPFDVPAVHRDGRELRISLTVRRDGHGFTGRLRELTGRTPPDLELVLRAAGQDPDLEDRHRLLTELSGLRTEFIRVASHELRTPLTSIITFATMLEAGDDVVALLAFDGAQTSIGPGPDPEGDEVLLRQLFHTAVSVAALANDAAQGTAGPVAVDAAHADGRWTIRVYAANAATLTAERLLSMRIPHPDQPNEHRTGALALMLGREIAARHDGTMVTSIERPGVTVRITLPDAVDTPPEAIKLPA